MAFASARVLSDTDLNCAAKSVPVAPLPNLGILKAGVAFEVAASPNLGIWKAGVAVEVAASPSLGVSTVGVATGVALGAVVGGEGSAKVTGATETGAAAEDEGPALEVETEVFAGAGVGAENDWANLEEVVDPPEGLVEEDEGVPSRAGGTKVGGVGFRGGAYPFGASLTAASLAAAPSFHVARW